MERIKDNIKTMRTHFTKAALSAAVISCKHTCLCSNSDQDIETLTVTGTRLPISLTKLPDSVSVLTESDIKASGALQLTDLIRGLPGVGLFSQAVWWLNRAARGGETNHLLVLIDGVVANDVGQKSG